MLLASFTKPQRKPIVLIGMMGAGKTTIGRALARATKREFIDLDYEIVQRCGVSIPTIFDIEGEEGFRRRESQVLSEIIVHKNIVLATGGGAILKNENRILLKQGHIIYLKAHANELFKRIAYDKNRPLMATDNPLERIQELLEKRDPIYQDLADTQIETGHGTIVSVVRKIQKELKMNKETS